MDYSLRTTFYAMKTKLLVFTLLVMMCFAAHSTSYYVSTSGSDSNSGSVSSPFATLTYAISVVAAGDIIYLRGGTYSYSSPIVVSRSKNGTSSSPIGVYAYSGETPILDFSGQSTSDSNRGVVMDAFYWHWKGITIQNAGDNGMLLSGNYNTIESCIFRGNRDSGLQLSRYTTSYDEISEWPSYNLITGCESYNNSDPDHEDADGFAAKLTSGEGNQFINCVSHHNIDDGWDLYTKSDTGPIGAVYLEGCISHNNGILTDGATSGDGDKNGYKLGSSSNTVNHIVRRCIAFNNGHHGFTDNGNIGSIEFTNCTSYNNADYNFHTRDDASHVFKNNLSYASPSNDRIVGNATAPNAFDNEDTWPYTATSSDFVTLTPGTNAAPTANGFLNLAAGSDLIDAGVTTTGITYSGSSPDLGAIEYGGSTSTTVSATLAASAGDGTVSLSWSTTGTITAQEVYRDTDSDPSGRVRIATLTTSDRTYTDNTVTNGTTYYYWIKLNGATSSNAASATPTATSTTGSISLSTSAGNATVGLTWSVSGITVTTQEVYRDTDSDPSGRVRIASVSSTTRSYTDATVTNGTTYYYWIKVNGTTNSNAASATPSGSTSSSTLRIEDTDAGTVSYDGSLKSYTNASNGTAINLSNADGQQIVWSYSAAAAGTYTLTFRYTRKSSMNSSVYILVNSGSAQTLSLPETSSDAFSTASLTATLVSGTNSILLETNADGESADIDWIEIASGSSARTAISETPLKFVLFPNPVASRLTISGLGETETGTLRIYNLSGMEMGKSQILQGPSNISLDHLPSGMYVVQIQANGQTMKKMILKK